MNHSQKLSEKPLTPWIICHKNGKIHSAHCDCMAGLNESCSHVGALLWAIDCGVKKRSSQTVTDKRAYWVLPPPTAKASYQPIRNIKFHAGQSTCKKSIVGINDSVPDVESFFNELSLSPENPAILALVPKYSSRYVPKSTMLKESLFLTNLYDPCLVNAEFSEISRKINEIFPFPKLDVDEQNQIRNITSNQNKCVLWAKLRTGRLTASTMKRTFQCKLDNPSKSYLKQICYPCENNFTSSATTWGNKHEDTALAEYKHLKSEHKNFEVQKCGLIIHSERTYIAASPDALVSCDCHGCGLCEIKVRNSVFSF